MTTFSKIKLAIVLVVLCVLVTLGVCACNMNVIDTTWSFDYAYIDLGDGTVVEGKVESWKDWNDSDMVQVKINGKTYYTHGSNVVLIDY